MKSDQNAERRFWDEISKLRDDINSVDNEVSGLHIQTAALNEMSKMIASKLTNGFTDRMARLEERANRNAMDSESLRAQVAKLNENLQLLERTIYENNTKTTRWQIGTGLAFLFGLAGLILTIINSLGK